MVYVILTVIKSLFLIVPVLLSVAFFTLFERKILAAIQLRIGCSLVGIYGFLQPFADALKLLSKELILPDNANLKLFMLTPYASIVLSLICWFIIPFFWNSVFADLNLGLIFLFSLSSLSVYAILVSGWASNSKYSFFGSLRACGLLISYEVCIGLILICVVVCSNSFNFLKIVEVQKDVWFILPLLPTSLLFFISALAETSRIPFDFPESESELVSGYNTEYSAVSFVFFFLSEYCRIVLMASIFTLCFLGGWDWPVFKSLPFFWQIFIVALKELFLIFFFYFG